MFADDAKDGCERRGIAVKWGGNQMGCTIDNESSTKEGLV